MTIYRPVDGFTYVLDHVPDPTRSYDIGVRAFEVHEMPEGTLDVTVSLIQGVVIVETDTFSHRVADHWHYLWGEHEGGFVGDGVTVRTVELSPYYLLPLPILPEKTWTLTAEGDKDGSGTVTPGDEVQYDIVFTAQHNMLRGSTFIGRAKREYAVG